MHTTQDCQRIVHGQVVDDFGPHKSREVREPPELPMSTVVEDRA